MEHILRAKFESCSQFREALMATGSKTLIEATPYWGCGINKAKATYIKTEFLPGQTISDELLMLIRKDINKISDTVIDIDDINT